MHRKILVSVAALGLAALSAAPAQATLFCEVLKTRDNFVALRAAPDPDAKMLARMKAGGEVRRR